MWYSIIYTQDNKVHDKDANAEKPLGIISLKIFKHYKLKPSFSIKKH